MGLEAVGGNNMHEQNFPLILPKEIIDFVTGLPEYPEIDSDMKKQWGPLWELWIIINKVNFDACKNCPYKDKCEYTTLTPDLRGESCQYYSLAERFGAHDK